MKNILTIIALFILTHANLISQSSIKFDFGLNTSNAFHMYIDTTGNKSRYKDNLRVLFRLGVSDEFKIKNTIFGIGLYLDNLGSNDYNRDSISYAILDKDLFLQYLTLPIYWKTKLNKSVFINLGIQPSYTIRKNQNFVALNTENKVVNTFNRTQFGVFAGFNLNLDDFGFYIEGFNMLTNIWDTKDYYPSSRFYLTVSSFRFGVLYYVHEKS